MAKGKGLLRLAIEDFLNTYSWGEWLAAKFEGFARAIEDNIFELWGDVLGGWRSAPVIGKFVPDPTERRGKRTLGWLPLLITILVGIGMMIVSAVGKPFSLLAEYWANRQAKPARFSVGDAIGALWFYGRDYDVARQDLLDLGYTEERINSLYKLSQALLSQGEYIALWLRGVISEGELNEYLRKRHLTDEQIEYVKKLAYYIPPPNDLIRLAVRDAWNEDVARRFGYDEEFPEEFATWSQKTGMSADWAKRYWRAHWQLPSPQMGFEMLHRLRQGRTNVPFSADDLDTLLKVSDYPKFYRERLKAISYSPYTRVDVRRMYQAGILSKDDVYQAYLDLGYDEEHAKNLTEFTIKYETGESDTKTEQYKALSLSLIKSGYVKRVINREDAVVRLRALRYDDKEIETILSIWDFEIGLASRRSYDEEYKSDLKSIAEKAYLRSLITDTEFLSYMVKIGYSASDAEKIKGVLEYTRSLSDLDERIDILHDLYMSGVLSYDETVVRMGKLNLSGSLQSYLLDKWTWEAEKRTKKLNEAQYRACFLNGLITADEYRKELRSIGYGDREVELLCRLYGIV